jgi:xylulokinase
MAISSLGEAFTPVGESGALLGNGMVSSDVRAVPWVASFNRPITTLAVTEAGCLGTAILACAADIGGSPSELVKTWVKTGAVVDPDPRRAARYDEQFGSYRELYPLMRQAWHRLQQAKRLPERPSKENAGMQW